MGHPFLSHAQSFRGLGDLPGGIYDSSAADISDDGSVVVGTSVSANGNEAYRWENGIMTSLRLALTDSNFSHAWGVSADGKVVTGSNHLGGKTEGFIWQAGSVTIIGELAGGMILNQPAGISADGLTVTGTGSSSLPFEAFLWRNNIIIGLGDLPGGPNQSFANAVSSDGSTVVGMSDSTVGQEAFRWHDNVLTGLGALPGGIPLSSNARAVSAGGGVVVGDGNSSRGIEAFRWENGVMVGLGDIPDGSGSFARGISSDGSVIVGFSYASPGQQAIIWFGGSAPVKLQDYAISSLGLGAQLSGWTLSEATAISADGRWIVGNGTNPQGNNEGWLLQIPASAGILSAPIITTHPASQSSTPGGSVTFTAAASGNPSPTFQWQRDGANIAGATSASLTLSNVTTSDAGSYAVIATNSVGSATSISATLTVSVATGAPAFTTQPSSQSVTVGGSVILTAAANGSPSPTYQWQKDGAIIPGATGASLTLTNLTTGNAGSYAVVATNSAGSAKSTSATLSVATNRLADQTVTVGHDLTLSAVNASGSLQWQVSSDNGTTWTNLTNSGSYSGATTSQLTILNLSSGQSGLRYRYVATDGTSVATSAAVTVTVAPALFPFPTSITLTSTGDLIVGDANANTVQRISPAGVVSLVAGSTGTAGSTDGSGALARFNQPSGLTVMADGSIMVADTGNATIRKIDGSTVTTVAGSPGQRGSTDGAGTAASFSSPTGLARAASGDIYIADAMNHVVRRLANANTVTTFAGGAGSPGFVDGTGATARFNFPTRVAIDASGNIFVADTTNNLIRRIAANGATTTLAGLQNVAGSTDGKGSTALFNRPGGIAVDLAGNLYVADTGNSTIRRITPAGEVTTIAGLPTIAGLEDAQGFYALFNHPQALCIDASGNIYIADTGNAAIRKIDVNLNVTTLNLTAASTPTPTPTTPTTPTVPTTPPSPAPSGGGGGGGGAPSAGFLVILAILAVSRRLFERHRSILQQG